MIRRPASELTWSEVSHNSEIKKQVFLKNGEAPNIVQCARSVFAPGQVSPGHSHTDLTETFLVTAGTLTIEVDGKIHTLPKGSSITLEPHEHHELSNQGPEELELIYFAVLI